MRELLRPRGYVGVVAVDHKRYVGARIGIYNPSGERVGKVSHVDNKELFFVATPDRDALEAAMRALANPDGSGPESSQLRPTH